MLAGYVSTDYLLCRTDSQAAASMGNVTNSAVAQGNFAKVLNGIKELCKLEADLYRIFEMLDGKRQNKLLNLAYEIRRIYGAS